MYYIDAKMSNLSFDCLTHPTQILYDFVEVGIITIFYSHKQKVTTVVLFSILTNTVKSDEVNFLISAFNLHRIS